MACETAYAERLVLIPLLLPGGERSVGRLVEPELFGIESRAQIVDGLGIFLCKELEVLGCECVHEVVLTTLEADSFLFAVGENVEADGGGVGKLMALRVVLEVVGVAAEQDELAGFEVGYGERAGGHAGVAEMRCGFDGDPVQRDGGDGKDSLGEMEAHG